MEIFMHRIGLTAAAMLIAAIVSSSVTTNVASAQTLNGRGDADKALTNCPPSSAGQTTGTSPDAQAVEKSAILPSAENHEQSAAPTVERNGESAEARIDCPQDPAQPKPKG
jgi:hypothetical protein